MYIGVSQERNANSRQGQDDERSLLLIFYIYHALWYIKGNGTWENQIVYFEQNEKEKLLVSKCASEYIKPK
jgi:hypothetical protein